MEGGEKRARPLYSSAASDVYKGQERERDTHTQTDRQTHTHTQRERERERESESCLLYTSPSARDP